MIAAVTSALATYFPLRLLRLQYSVEEVDFGWASGSTKGRPSMEEVPVDLYQQGISKLKFWAQLELQLELQLAFQLAFQLVKLEVKLEPKNSSWRSSRAQELDLTSNSARVNDAFS